MPLDRVGSPVGTFHQQLKRTRTPVICHTFDQPGDGSGAATCSGITWWHPQCTRKRPYGWEFGPIETSGAPPVRNGGGMSFRRCTRVSMVRHGLVLFALAAALVIDPVPAGADPILPDQFAIPSCCLSSGVAVTPSQSISQTFTAGIAGFLTSVEVSIFQDRGTTGDVVFRLLREPLDFRTSVYSTIIPLTMVPFETGRFVSVDVSSAHVALAVGDQLAIGLSRPVGAWNQPWVLWNTATYDRGSAFAPGIGEIFADVAFRTNMDPVPEPTSLVLFATGLTAAWARRRLPYRRLARGLAKSID